MSCEARGLAWARGGEGERGGGGGVRKEVLGALNQSIELKGNHLSLHRYIIAINLRRFLLN